MLTTSALYNRAKKSSVGAVFSCHENQPLLRSHAQGPFPTSIPSAPDPGLRSQPPHFDRLPQANPTPPQSIKMRRLAPATPLRVRWTLLPSDRQL